MVSTSSNTSNSGTIEALRRHLGTNGTNGTLDTHGTLGTHGTLDTTRLVPADIKYNVWKLALFSLDMFVASRITRFTMALP